MTSIRHCILKGSWVFLANWEKRHTSWPLPLYIYTLIFALHSGLDLLFPRHVHPAASFFFLVLSECDLRDVPFCPRSSQDLQQLTSDRSGAPEREREQEIKCEAF